jgi:YbgC/YbaW family acyl-CoA thioester hydrolase
MSGAGRGGTDAAGDEPVSGGFVYRRRVQFAETDLAGIVHFSMYFRYMEEAEHALWRAAGLTIGGEGIEAGWPRVAAAFDYKRPLTFDDEFEVRIGIARVSARTIRYACRVTRAGTPIGHGTLTTVCVRKQPGGPMSSIAIPEGLVARLTALTGDRPEVS